jgi:methyl-accepting chemotaxis protein
MEQQNRMPIGPKIALIGASFFLPIAVLLMLMVNSMSASIEFAEKELAGSAVLRPLMGFQAAVHDYLEVAGCGAEATCAAQRETAKAVAESTLTLLDRQMASHGQILQFNPEGLNKRSRGGKDAAGLRSAWTRFSQADPAQPEFAAAYTDVADMTRTMITHAGDTSNLILDPDLDSYYLMDAVLIAAPQMQDRLASIEQLSRASKGSESDRLKLAVAAAMFAEADFGRLVASTNTAINEDPNFYGVSSTLRPRLEAPLVAVSDPAKKLLEALRNGGSGESTVKLAHETRKANFAYWNQASEELEALLKIRIGDYAGQRTRAILISGLAVLGASLLAFFLLQSITKPLEKLVRSLGPGATLLSGCVEKIAEVTQQQTPSAEEASIICEELNAHADDMRKAVLELARQVRGADAEEMASSAAGIQSAAGSQS